MEQCYGCKSLAERIEQTERALDAEREKVKELVANQAEYEKCTDEQITALNQGCLDYEKQIATLQAQLAALRHDYAQLKEAYDAKESGVPLGPVVGAQTIVNQQREINRLQAQLRHMTKERDIQKEVADNQAWHVRDLKAQLRQVEGERDHAKKMEAVQKEVADNQAWHVQKLKGWRDTVTLALQRPGGARFEDVPGHIKALVKEHDTLRQLVAALPVVDVQEVSVWLSPDESGWFVSKRPAFPAGLYWAKFRTQAEADSFRALLAYRATLAAQDAGKEDVSHD